MSIALLLSNKGRQVLTVQPLAPLQEVIELLAAKLIGSLVVVDTFGTMLGIVSERDVVRAIASHGAQALSDIVAKYMTINVIIGREAESVDAVLQKMNEERFRHLPIAEDDRLVGIVSQGDAIKFRLDEMEVEHAAMQRFILS